MAGTTGLPFWINLGDGFATASSAKTKGVKPLMAGMACPFFGAGAFECTSDSIIFSMMTKVGGAEGILHRRSCKYSS